jgi:uncharacterized protein YigE (DUF2233 family)
MNFRPPAHPVRAFLFPEQHMAQVEHIADMQVGDFIQLPAGIWHLNADAQALFAQAQQFMRAYQGEDMRPQFSVESDPGPGFKARLERIR